MQKQWNKFLFSNLKKKKTFPPNELFLPIQKYIWGSRCVVRSAVLWYDTTSVTTTPTNLLGLDVLFGYLSTFLKDSAASVYGLGGL